MKLTAYKPESRGYDGTLLPEFSSEWEPPIMLHEKCFVICKNWLGRYQVVEMRTTSFWFTNIWGWRMDNGYSFLADEYNKRIFKHEDLQNAIEICEKKNRMKKVKVKYLE